MDERRIREAMAAEAGSAPLPGSLLPGRAFPGIMARARRRWWSGLNRNHRLEAALLGLGVLGLLLGWPALTALKEAPRSAVSQPVQWRGTYESLVTGPVDLDGRYHWPLAGGPEKAIALVSPPVFTREQAYRSITLYGRIGDPVRAAHAGTVTFADWNEEGLGLLVVIQGEDGIETFYGHLKLNEVWTGQQVEQGQVIGTVGVSGKTVGPGLLFGARRDGVPIDPLSLFQ